MGITNYSRAKKWFMIGFGYSVNIFNGETDPNYIKDEDLLDLFLDRWAKEDLGPIHYKQYLKDKMEEIKENAHK